MKKKVLIIDNSIGITGALKTVLVSTRDLKDSYHFSFLIPKSSNNKALISSMGFPCYQAPMIEISRRVVDLIRYLPFLLINSIRIAKLVKTEKITLIHVNDIYNLTGLIVKIWTKVKVITHVRRMPESFPESIYRIWVWLHSRFADQIIAVSKANATSLGVHMANKVKVVYDSIPAEEKLEEYECIQRSHVRLLYLANYTRGKGQEYAVTVATRLVEMGIKNFEIHFYGGDFGIKKNHDFKLELQEKSSHLDLDCYLHFHNSKDDIEKLMKQYDIVLNWSDSESFSNVSLEALYYGLPLIATDVGGTCEMFQDGESGILVKKGDTVAMSQCMAELIRSFDNRQAMSTAARKYVRTNFSMENTTCQLAKVYEED